MTNKNKSRKELSVLIILIFSVILSGCTVAKVINKDENMTIKYLDSGPIMTQKDFPDFTLINSKYYVAQENISVSLQVEGMHGENVINDTGKLPKGYRIYGISESYNSSNDTNNYDRYILLQYKVFDTDEDLNDSMNITAVNYEKAGFKHKILDNITLDRMKNITDKGRIFVIESNYKNRTDVNITIILFGFDTLLGKIGVQDSKERSLAEALRVLEISFGRLKIYSKLVEPINMKGKI